MSKSGSFFDRDAVISACNQVIFDCETERRKRKSKYCDENRYERQFPKFWKVKKLTNAEILDKARNNSSVHNWDWWELDMKYDRETTAMSICRLAERSDGRVYITRKDFKHISKYMMKVVTP